MLRRKLFAAQPFISLTITANRIEYTKKKEKKDKKRKSDAMEVDGEEEVQVDNGDCRLEGINFRLSIACKSHPQSQSWQLLEDTKSIG